VYQVSDDLDVEPVPERRDDLPFVELDERFYRVIDALEARFPDGPPSLRGAARLVVRGDVTFGAGVVVRGSVTIDAPQPRRIEAGALLEGGGT
jgi:UTP--glucose-1-phosphate uridylyltransferase